VLALPVLPGEGADGVLLGPGADQVAEDLGTDLLALLEMCSATGKAGEVTSLPVPLGGERNEALQFWKRLVEHGVYVNLMLPPATPNGVSLIRCSVSAAHSSEQIDAVCRAFSDLRSAAGIVAAELGTG